MSHTILHHVLRRAQKPTMWACNALQCLLGELAGAHNNKLRVRWHGCQCAWRVWAFDRQPTWQPWLSVPLGRMRCPRLPPRLFCTCPTHTLVWGNCKTHRTCATIAGPLDVHYGRNCVNGQDSSEWPHGWQYFTSSVSEHHCRDRCAPSVVHRRQAAPSFTLWSRLRRRSVWMSFTTSTCSFPNSRVGETSSASHDQKLAVSAERAWTSVGRIEAGPEPGCDARSALPNWVETVVVGEEVLGFISLASKMVLDDFHLFQPSIRLLLRRPTSVTCSWRRERQHELAFEQRFLFSLEQSKG